MGQGGRAFLRPEYRQICEVAATLDEEWRVGEGSPDEWWVSSQHEEYLSAPGAGLELSCFCAPLGCHLDIIREVLMRRSSSPQASLPSQAL